MMSGQSATAQLTKIQSQLECPVCLKIPVTFLFPAAPQAISCADLARLGE